MRILWLHQYFATPAGWGSVRTYEFGRRFVAAGHAVDVLCCAAYDPSLAGRGEVEIAGMRVRVSRTRYCPQMGFLTRVGAFLSFAAFALWHVLRQGRKYDLIVASSGPLTMAIPALAAQWIHGTPFVFEVIDVWPDAAIEAGVLRNRLLQWLAFRLEAAAYQRASRIVTCSPGMTTRILRKGVAAERIVTIPNCCDLDVFRPDPARRVELRATLGVRDGQFVVAYTGAMGRSNAVDDIVRAAKQLAGDVRIVWWFAGDGAEADRIRALPTARMFGALPRKRVVELCQAADAALLTFLPAPLFEENSPIKFFDAISAGLPMIFNRSTWLQPEIAQYGCGFVCSSKDPATEMAMRIRQLADDSALRARLAAGARRLAEERYSRDELAKKYLKALGGG